MPEKIIATDENIRELVKNAIEKYGPDCDLNFIDVSQVTNMDNLFRESEFNGDISQWDVSNVTTMCGMFEWPMTLLWFLRRLFNGDISQWDVSKVTNMSRMFAGSQFNGDISHWNVSNVTDMHGMFEGGGTSIARNSMAISVNGTCQM